MSYASHMLSRQTERDRNDQVKNNAGGYVFKLAPFKQLERFLILGSDSNTYYQTARALTRENAQVVTECWKLDPQFTLKTIVEISLKGRAPKNDPAIFALALGTLSDDVKVRQMVYGSLFQVCRTATHVFMFIDFCQTLGKGWGRGLKNTIARWYSDTPVDRLALQMVKYRNRHNFTHKRLLQTSHPKLVDGDPARQALIRWAVDKEYDEKSLPVIIQDFLQAQRVENVEFGLAESLPWEALPTQWLNDGRTWQALLPGMGTTALIRNLAKMSSVGVLKALSKEEAYVVERLNDKERILKDRIHPMNLMFAMKTYGSGHGFRGGNQWEVNREVLAALEDAFYISFGGLPEGKKRTYIGLDVSGSMSAVIANSNVTCREAASAMAMVTIKSEPQVMVRGFTAGARNPGNYYSRGTELQDLGITRHDTLEGTMKKAYNAQFGATDCSLPIRDAIDRGLSVDQFVIYTDNETYAGKEHPYKTLQEYRRKSGIDAKMVVVGMTSTGFSIADPTDPGMLDVVGFDTSAPSLIAEF